VIDLGTLGVVRRAPLRAASCPPPAAPQAPRTPSLTAEGDLFIVGTDAAHIDTTQRAKRLAAAIDVDDAR
jgi:hypothetical protein